MIRLHDSRRWRCQEALRRERGGEQILVSVYCENKGFDCKRSGSSKEPLMGLSGSGKPKALRSLLTFLTSTMKFTFSLSPAPACSLFLSIICQSGRLLYEWKCEFYKVLRIMMTHIDLWKCFVPLLLKDSLTYFAEEPPKSSPNSPLLPPLWPLGISNHSCHAVICPQQILLWPLFSHSAQLVIGSWFNKFKALIRPSTTLWLLSENLNVKILTPLHKSRILTYTSHT